MNSLRNMGKIKPGEAREIDMVVNPETLEAKTMNSIIQEYEYIKEAHFRGELVVKINGVEITHIREGLANAGASWRLIISCVVGYQGCAGKGCYRWEKFR